MASQMIGGGFVKARSIATTILAGTIAFGTSGCTLLAPQSTTNQYEPSDGVGGTVGVVDIRNAVLISDDGLTANLVVSLVNTGANDESVEIQYRIGTRRVNESVQVPAARRVDLGGPGQPLFILTNINTTPGGLFPVFFQYGNQTGVELLVPVLTSELPEYAHLSPNDVAPGGIPLPGTPPLGTPSPAAPSQTPQPTQTSTP